MLPLIAIMNDGVESKYLFSSFYIPTQMIYFINFMILFEFACNLWADISGLADKQFYQDYWNCTNFDEYARKWNRLVHEFLYRHFYLEYLFKWRLTKMQASVITFAFSVLFHEIFLSTCFGRTSWYLTSL